MIELQVIVLMVGILIGLLIFYVIGEMLNIAERSIPFMLTYAFVCAAVMFIVGMKIGRAIGWIDL